MRSYLLVTCLIVLTSLLVSQNSADDIVEQTRLAASNGETVELACRFLASNTTIAEWRYRKSRRQSALRVSWNGTVLPRYRRRFAVKMLNDSAGNVSYLSLRISPVTYRDVGIYICSITDQSSEVRRFVHLDVTEAAVIRTAQVGSDVTLPCSSTFLNPVKWVYHNQTSKAMMTLVKEGHVMMSRVSRFSVRNGSNLVINDVTMSDGGLYFCIEDDGYGWKHPIILSVTNSSADNFTTTAPSRVGIVIEMNEEELTYDGHPRASRTSDIPRMITPTQSVDWHVYILVAMVIVIAVVLAVIANQMKCNYPGRSSNRSIDDEGSELDSDSSTDDFSLVPTERRRRRKARKRLGGVSDNDFHDSAVPFTLEPDDTVPTSQTFPGPGKTGPESLPTSNPVVESQLESESIPEHGEHEPPRHAFPGRGSCPADVIVVHATVESQPSAGLYES